MNSWTDPIDIIGLTPSTSLTGSSDITKELLDTLLSDYSVGGLEVVEMDLD